MSRKIPEKLQVWIDASKWHRLSHTQVQMARELGMNPKKLGKIGNHEQERWKVPLPQFIEECYRNRFGKEAPDDIRSMEERANDLATRKAVKKSQRDKGETSTTEATESDNVPF